MINPEAFPVTFDSLRVQLRSLPVANESARAAARQRDKELTKPAGALGRLEELVVWLAGWQGVPAPAVMAPAIAVFAGNHGVAARGVSPYPSEVTAQMVSNFAAGGAAINQICRATGVSLSVHPIELDRPTQDFAFLPAMSAEECCRHIATGMAALPPVTDLFAVGEMGIGNTTSAAAIYAALYGGDVARFVGRGTGVDEAGLARKLAVIEMAMKQHAGRLSEPLEILRRFGGREIAAAFGAIMAARQRRVAVVLDGYVVTAAAALLHAIDPVSLDHCIAGHCSAEGAHAEVLQRLGLPPLLSLGMRLGEGTGAALAMGIVRAACACHAGMATFASAGVSNR